MSSEEYVVARVIELEARVKKLEIEKAALQDRVDTLIDDKVIIRKLAKIVKSQTEGIPYISFDSVWSSSNKVRYETIKKILWLTEEEEDTNEENEEDNGNA